MLNHARMLLMNKSTGALQGFAYLGDEAVAPNYLELDLPSYLLSLRAVLFGTNPDRHFLNYRLRQFLTLIHSTPLVQFVLDLDPRITYSIGTDTTLTDGGRFKPEIIQVSGSLSDVLSVFGSPVGPDSVGRMKHALLIDIITNESIRVEQRLPPFQQTILGFALTDGASQPLPLGDSGYSFRLHTTNVGASWLVEVLNRPQWDLGQIVASLGQVGEPVFLQLFGTASVEPYRTFRALWFDQSEMPLRLAALLLAIVYRTEEERKVQNS